MYKVSIFIILFLNVTFLPLPLSGLLALSSQGWAARKDRGQEILLGWGVLKSHFLLRLAVALETEQREAQDFVSYLGTIWGKPRSLVQSRTCLSACASTEDNERSSPPSRGTQVLNGGCQAWRQALLPNEPSHPPRYQSFKCLSTMLEAWA